LLVSSAKLSGSRRKAKSRQAGESHKVNSGNGSTDVGLLQNLAGFSSSQNGSKNIDQFHMLTGNNLTQFFTSFAKAEVLSSRGYRKFMK